MAYNKARAEKKWLKWKEAEEKKLRELGVDEETIQRLHTYDWAEFNDVRLENGEPIPTLDDYLEQSGKHPETVLVFELKPAADKDFENRMTDLSIEKLKEYGLNTPDRVIFISFSIR